MFFTNLTGVIFTNKLKVFKSEFDFSINIRPSLKNCQLGATSVKKRHQEGREFLFFLRNPFKYCADAVLVYLHKTYFCFFYRNNT